MICYGTFICYNRDKIYTSILLLGEFIYKVVRRKVELLVENKIGIARESMVMQCVAKGVGVVQIILN